MLRTLTKHPAAPVLATALIGLLAACATAPPPERGVVEADAMHEDEGIVFGMVLPRSYDSRGKELTGDRAPDLPYELYIGTPESVTLKRVFSGFTQRISGNAQQPQTFFAIKLPAGEYTLFKLNRPLGRTTGDVPIDVRFTVTPSKAAYIGSLQIDFRATRGLFGSETAGEKVVLKVVDEPAQAIPIYKERNPDAKPAIVTNLMKMRRP